MEKYLKLFFVALFATLSFSLTSCGDDDDDAPADTALAGTWRESYYDSDTGNCTATIKFVSSSKCILSETFENYPEDNYSQECSYTISGNLSGNAHLTLWGKDLDGHNVKQEFLVTITGDQMFLYDLDEDETRVLRRIN